MHNTSTKSISGITNLIYFRDIWKKHVKFWKNIFFSGDMSQVFGTLLFFQQAFFEATCISCFWRYPSSAIPGYEVFSHSSWELKHFFGRFASVLMCFAKKNLGSLFLSLLVLIPLIFRIEIKLPLSTSFCFGLLSTHIFYTQFMYIVSIWLFIL